MKRMLMIWLLFMSCKTSYITGNKIKEFVADYKTTYSFDSCEYNVFYFDTSIYDLCRKDTIIITGNIHNGLCCWVASDTFYTYKVKKKLFYINEY